MLIALVAGLPGWAAREDSEEEALVFELESFEVYAGEIKTIDGMTGKKYTRSNAVVSGFRRDFNKILLNFHRRLLVDEFKHTKARVDELGPFHQDLEQLAESFGFPGLPEKNNQLFRERSITGRLIKDPFFKIEALIVWHISELEGSGRRLPKNKYAHDIRFNDQTETWERRVTTEWEVRFLSNNGRNQWWFHTVKEQGLNLDTNEGYHFIERGLPQNVPPHAFKEVRLTYPIFIRKGEDEFEQVQALKRRFVENLVYIYDPYSWVARRNTRFRGGYASELREIVEETKHPIPDRKWFDPVITAFLNDVVTIKYQGVHEIYDFKMLQGVQDNRNVLGRKLDLLNWKPGENRSVDYNPDRPRRNIRVNINNPGNARFILLDAYRRYGDKFVDALRRRVFMADGSTTGKEMVLQSIEEASGVRRSKYLPLAAKAQEAELKKFRRG